MKNYAEVEKDVQTRFTNIYKSKAIVSTINFTFIEDSNQKVLVTISKISDKFKFITKKDILVIINSDLYDKFDDADIDILMEQEVDRIAFNMDNGTIKLRKPDFSTFSSLLHKHGYKKVLNANQINVLTNDNEFVSSN